MRAMLCMTAVEAEHHNAGPDGPVVGSGAVCYYSPAEWRAAREAGDRPCTCGIRGCGCDMIESEVAAWVNPKPEMVYAICQECLEAGTVDGVPRARRGAADYFDDCRTE